MVTGVPNIDENEMSRMDKMYEIIIEVVLTQEINFKTYSSSQLESLEEVKKLILDNYPSK